MTQSYTLQEAQNQLKELIEAAVQGDTIVIVRENGEQAVQLVPVTTERKLRKAGSARNQIVMQNDFDAPLSDFDELIPGGLDNLPDSFD